MLKYKDKIINGLGNILMGIIIIICIFCIYSFISLQVLKNEYVNIFGFTIFEVATGSMSPEIEASDMILVKLNSTYQEGDIITYQKDNDYITHRIIKVNNKELITKGDANNSEDAPVNKENVIGKVVRIFPNLGVWKKVFLTPKVMLSCLATVLLFDICFRGKKGEEQNEKNEQDEQI